jgi:hypothetical protein
LCEKLGYKHVSDLLQGMTSAELTGWFAYMRVDDEVRAQKAAYAIVKAYNGDKTDGKQPKNKGKKHEEEEEVIDTTDPEFAEHFRGFTYGDKPRAARPRQNVNTEILIG